MQSRPDPPASGDRPSCLVLVDRTPRPLGQALLRPALGPFGSGSLPLHSGPFHAARGTSAGLARRVSTGGYWQVEVMLETTRRTGDCHIVRRASLRCLHVSPPQAGSDSTHPSLPPEPSALYDYIFPYIRSSRGTYLQLFPVLLRLPRFRAPAVIRGVRASGSVLSRSPCPPSGRIPTPW